MHENTILFDAEEVSKKNIKETLYLISQDLEERGYNPIKQITGYLVSGDPGYITSYKECRNRIIKLDKNLIIETIVSEYLTK